jgi:hypothetical protein
MVDNNGNIGIGTAGPGRKLEVYEDRADGGLAGIKINNPSSSASTTAVKFGVELYNGGNYEGALYADRASRTFLDSGASNKVLALQYNSGGNVGIGTITASYKLTVEGVVYSSTGGFRFPDGTTQTTAASGGIPSGTVMLFVQTSAPTGWTKDTTSHNNKALRVVTGTASSGGSVGFTTAFASQAVAGTVTTNVSGNLSTVAQGGNISTSVSGSVSGSVGSTTLATSQIPSHNHSASENGVGITVYDSNLAAGGPYGSVSRAGTQSTGRSLDISSTGGGGSHNHNWSGNFSGSGSSTFTGSNHNHNFSGSGSSSFSGTAINLAVQYVDVIIATKD